MPSLLIIGSGILGLCVAAYFAKHHPEFKLRIISDENPMSGSYAAAANLSTKGQMVGRDPHFQIKIEAKQKYKDWIRGFLTEMNPEFRLTEDFYQEGLGIDFFECEEDAKIQWKRVFREQNEPITHPYTHQIHYEKEAWVHAPTLLKLLKDYLIFKKVDFIHDDIKIHHLKKENTLTVFCTGAWTPQILCQLGLPLPRGFLKPVRLTIGSTFFGSNIFKNSHPQAVLQDKILHNAPQSELTKKITFSGSPQHQYLSSTSVKLFPSPDFSFQISEDQHKNLTLQNQALLQGAQSTIHAGGEPLLLPHKTLTTTTGLRIGFGHSEIVIEKIETQKCNAIVCAGAHKSGFLFAPMVGEQVYKLIDKV